MSTILLPLHHQFKSGFTPSALVIVSTNETIQSCDYTSGLARRRISIPMFNQIKSDRQKNLIEHKNGKMYGDFLPYIPGLLNWVLEMDEEKATSIVKNYEANVPSLLAMKARTLVETNPIADWLDNYVIYQAEARTNVGVAKRDKDSNSPSWYLDTEKWLYANYCEYCHNSGTRPVSLRRFVTLLSDLGKNQLGLDIRKERDCAPRTGEANRFGSYFVGLKIRTAEDDSLPLITGNCEVLKDTVGFSVGSFPGQLLGKKLLSQNVTAPKTRRTATHIVINTNPRSENTNVISKLWTMVMDRVTDMMDYVTDMMDYVMDESVDGDECDECDGKNEKSSEFKNSAESKINCNTKTEENLK